MNGWLRLWVLVSVVWAVVVVSVAAIIIPDKLEAAVTEVDPLDALIAEAERESAKFDVRLPNGYLIKGVPKGTSKDVIKDTAIKSGWATAADFQQDESAASLVISVPTLERKLTLEEMAGYTSESRAEKNQHERQEVIRTSIMVSIIPPLMLFLLGYGFAWVLRGFGS